MLSWSEVSINHRTSLLLLTRATRVFSAGSVTVAPRRAGASAGTGRRGGGSTRRPAPCPVCDVAARIPGIFPIAYGLWRGGRTRYAVVTAYRNLRERRRQKHPKEGKNIPKKANTSQRSTKQDSRVWHLESTEQKTRVDARMHLQSALRCGHFTAWVLAFRIVLRPGSCWRNASMPTSAHSPSIHEFSLPRPTAALRLKTRAHPC